MAEPKNTIFLREAFSGLMLGTLVGALTGLSTSPIAKDVVIGLVTLLGMFFGLRPKSEGGDNDERARVDFQRRNDSIRLIGFCAGCIAANGVAIWVRDTMWLIPLEKRPFAALTIEQRLDRLEQIDHGLERFGIESWISPEFVLGVEQEQALSYRTGANAALELQDLRMPANAAPEFEKDTGASPGSAMDTCTKYKRLIEEAHSDDLAEEQEKIEKIIQQYLDDADWADIGRFVSDYAPYQQSTLIQALTWLRCEDQRLNCPAVPAEEAFEER